jgi:hypothetical protein
MTWLPRRSYVSKEKKTSRSFNPGQARWFTFLILTTFSEAEIRRIEV